MQTPRDCFFLTHNAIPRTLACATWDYVHHSFYYFPIPSFIFRFKRTHYKAQWTYWKNVRRIDGVRKIYEKLTQSVRSKHSLLFPYPTSTTPYAHPYSIFSSNYCENCKNNSNQQKCSAIPNTFINFPSITQREHDDYSHRDEVTTQSHPRLHSNRNSW